MEFEQLVIENVVPVFEEHGLIIAQHYKNYFLFKSNIVEATISYNELDRTCLFEIGRVNHTLYPLNNKLIKQVFGSSLEIENVTKEKFVLNIVSFFKNEGLVLLQGNKLSEVEVFTKMESREYTSQMVHEQNLTAANRAWENQNYKEFIKIIDQIGKDKLSSSYQLKYKIANQRR